MAKVFVVQFCDYEYKGCPVNSELRVKRAFSTRTKAMKYVKRLMMRYCKWAGEHESGDADTLVVEGKGEFYYINELTVY